MIDSVRLLNDKLISCLSMRDYHVDEITHSSLGILTDHLMETGDLTGEQANHLLEEASGFPAIDPRLISYSASFLSRMHLLIPVEAMWREHVFPIKQEGNYVHLVMADPLNSSIEAEFESLTGSRIQRYCCNTSALEDALGRHFIKQETPPETPDQKIELAIKAINRIRNEQGTSIWDLINHPRVIHLLGDILAEATEKNASDIHFEPLRTCLRIRARLDGVLHTIHQLDNVAREGIIPRIKMIADMKLDITSSPQDGRIDYHVVRNKEIDIRCSVLPTVYGEKAVLRILDKGRQRLRLRDFNLDQYQLGLLEKAIHRPNGLVLATGPTGSGKSTTLYSFLDELNTEDVNITTAEDPVEYELDGIIQVPCDRENGVDFAGALRSFLRQDPDIIMVGEIRDLETADIAVKSALTGHLVLSTLHTNDAASAIARIINLGVPPFLLFSCGLTVLAQRLLRLICNNCKEKFIPETATLKALGLEAESMPYFRGRGCSQCSGTGYRGRILILEILVVNDELERLILSQSPVSEIKQVAIRNGMVTLRDDALRRMAQGLTCPEEVLRVTLDV